MNGKFTGSLHFDAAMQPGHRNATRWDYVVSTATRVDAAEVHPVVASEIASVVAKKTWSEPQLAAAGARIDAWHWLATDAGVGFRRGGSEEKRLIDARIAFPKRVLIA